MLFVGVKWYKDATNYLRESNTAKKIAQFLSKGLQGRQATAHGQHHNFSGEGEEEGLGRLQGARPQPGVSRRYSNWESRARELIDAEIMKARLGERVWPRP